MVPTLTPRQRQILELIRQLYHEHKVAPTLRELQHHLGLRSVATVAQHVKRLRALGLLLPEGGRRSLLPVHRADEPTVVEERSGAPPMVAVPFMGFFSSRGIETLPIPRMFHPPPGTFTEGARGYALQLRGGDLQDQGLLDGDLLLIEVDRVAQGGDAVLVREGAEWTLGRYAPDGEYVCITTLDGEQPLLYRPRMSLEVMGLLLGVWRIYQL